MAKYKIRYSFGDEEIYTTTIEAKSINHAINKFDPTEETEIIEAWESLTPEKPTEPTEDDIKEELSLLGTSIGFA